MDILSAFSTPIIICDIEENTEELKNESNYIKNYSQKPTGNIDIRDKENQFRILEKYPRIKKILLNKFKNFAKEKLNYTNDFIITTSWITRITKGEIGQFHCHKNSFWSGVYYFDEYNSNSGSLEFQSPLLNFSDFELIPTKWNGLTARTFKFPPRKNQLILFPSYLFHQVTRCKDDYPRRSLAFNIIPIGKYGNQDSFYDINWVPRGW